MTLSPRRYTLRRLLSTRSFGLTSLTWTACLAPSMACSKSNAEGAALEPVRPPLHVQTVSVDVQPMPRYLRLTGSLVANQQSDLAADATGKVLATLVDRGSLVARGAPLIQLDTRSAQLNQREAVALADVAREQQKLAEQECARSRKLLDSGAISQADYDRTSSQCETSGSNTLAVQARKDLTSKTLGDANIRAPFAGMIAEKYVSVGEYVLPQTKVATLLEIAPLRLQLTVPETAVPSVKQDQRVLFNTSAYPDQTFDGTIRYMGPSLRGNSRDLVVEAVAPNTDGKLRPGMFVTARLDLGMTPSPVVPKDSVKEDGQIHRLYVVVDHQIEERLVQIGEAKGDLVSVADGVKAGDAVVVHPPDTIADGMRVE